MGMALIGTTTIESRGHFQILGNSVAIFETSAIVTARLGKTTISSKLK
jgi:hypothetical protein